MIHKSKKDFENYNIYSFIMYNELPSFINNNKNNIHFTISWEVSYGSDITYIFNQANIPVISISCGILHIPLSLNFIDNKNNFLINRPGYSIQYTLPHHYRSLMLKKHLYSDLSNYIFPYVWKPTFITCPEIKLSYETTQFQHIYIMEPNFDVVKNNFIPIIALIHLYNTNTTLLHNIKIHLLCSNTIKNSILSLINCCCKNPSDFTSHISINGRFSIKDLIIKKQHKEPSIIISHQYQNELNYIYFDCLYSKIPIIHNSTMIGNCGYTYKDNDIYRICSHLTNLITNGVNYHIKYIDSQTNNIQTLFDTLDPLNSKNLEYMKYLCDSITKKQFDIIRPHTNFGPLKNEFNVGI